MRQHLVRREIRDRRIRDQFVERIQAAAEKEEAHPGRNAHRGAENHRLARFAQGFRGDVTLHHILVAGVIGGVADHAEQQQHGKGAVVQPPRHRPEAELVVGKADPQHVGEALRQFVQHQPHAEYPAQQQDHRLDHIRPDHRLDSSDHGVQRDEETADHDHRRQAAAGHPGDRQGDQIEHRRQPDELGDHKAERRIRPEKRAVTRLQIFKGAGRPAPPEERDEKPDRQQRRKRHREAVHRLPVVQHIRRRRQREECDRTDRSAEHRQPDRPAGESPVAEKILLCALVFFAEVKTDARHRGQIKQNGTEVRNSEHGALRKVRRSAGAAGRDR